MINCIGAESIMVQFRIHQNRRIKIQKTRLYRVNLKRGGQNSHPFVCSFHLLINAFLLVFLNIFLQLEDNPLQIRFFVFLSSGFGVF